MRKLKDVRDNEMYVKTWLRVEKLIKSLKIAEKGVLDQ